jgi:hypothetical protein
MMHQPCSCDLVVRRRRQEMREVIATREDRPKKLALERASAWAGLHVCGKPTDTAHSPWASLQHHCARLDIHLENAVHGPLAHNCRSTGTPARTRGSRKAAREMKLGSDGHNE